MTGQDAGETPRAFTRRMTIACGGAASLAVPRLAFAEPAAPVVSTTRGKISGFAERGVSIFRGIRYGQDTRQFRFCPPAPPAPWSDVRPALAFGTACPQTHADEPTSEDCLFLNVWTPGLDHKARPVMV